MNVTQLLGEFKFNIWTVEEYCDEWNKLDEVYGSPKKKTHHALSPNWDESHIDQDIEGDEL